MLRSNEAPENENFVERLIPTGSISMKNTLRGLEVRGFESLKKVKLLLKIKFFKNECPFRSFFD